MIDNVLEWWTSKKKQSFEVVNLICVWFMEMLVVSKNHPPLVASLSGWRILFHNHCQMLTILRMNRCA